MQLKFFCVDLRDKVLTVGKGGPSAEKLVQEIKYQGLIFSQWVSSKLDYQGIFLHDRVQLL